MLNDIFNNMVYQEEIHQKNLYSAPAKKTPTNKSRNYDLKTAFDPKSYDIQYDKASEGKSYYIKPRESNLISPNESTESNIQQKSMFDIQKFSNKDSIMDHIKKKHSLKSKKTKKQKKSG